MHTINVRVTHKKADVPILEAVSFPDQEKALLAIKAIPSIEGVAIVQTCNRMEIFAATKNVSLAHHDLLDFLMAETISKFKKRRAEVSPEFQEKMLEHMIAMSKKLHDVIEVDSHANAVIHLLRLACGLESMIIGEDQILGQIKESHALSQKLGATNEFLSTIFAKAINVGKRARTETKINKGAVSIASAAVDLAMNELGELSDKNVLIVGAGEMGKLVSKSLCELNLKNVAVANRTYEKGVKVAQLLGGKAVEFSKLKEEMKKSDLVITATGAPERIIKKADAEEVMRGREKKPLVIVDVANPRDVEESVAKVSNVKLLNIDSLRQIADENMKKRAGEIIKVEEIIETEYNLLQEQLYHVDVEKIIKAVFESSEKTRKNELEKALKMLGNGVTEREKEVIDDLTKVILKKTMAPIIKKIRVAAEISDQEAIKAAEMYFIGNGESE